MVCGVATVGFESWHRAGAREKSRMAETDTSPDGPAHDSSDQLRHDLKTPLLPGDRGMCS